MTDRKVPRDNAKISLAPLDFEEALADLLRVAPPPKETKRETKPPKEATPPPPKKRKRPETTT